MERLRLGLAQINPLVGDLEGNAEKIIAEIERARGMGVELLAFPELAITGYPPEDLLLKPSFVAANLEALEEVVRHTEGITA
ncbi:MAG: nitrilase-related carbon-nitrogen hydrolase, partial [Candidatus Bipolaricaulia bacterium]